MRYNTEKKSIDFTLLFVFFCLTVVGLKKKVQASRDG